jgi:hypothetical protein
MSIDMILALWMSCIFLLGAILIIWLMRTLQYIERQPWW